MTALTASKDRVYKAGKLLAFPLAVDIMYKGALMKVNAAGYLAPCAAEAGVKFAGVAYEEVDNSAGSAGDVVGRVERVGVHLMQGTGFNQASVGSKVFASDDNTVSTTQGANEQEVGTVVEYVSSTEVWVDITPPAGAFGNKIEAGEIAAGAITLAKLDAGVLPSHVAKFAGEFPTVGGDANETIAAVGVLATDIVLVTMHTVGTTPVTILTASASADQIDVVMSADPSNDHVLSYVVLRAAA